MTSQMINRSQVAPGKLAIRPAETSTPMIGTNGTHGVLNGRGRSGRLLRRIHVPAETITKASSVPMLTSSPRISIGTKAEKKATQIPTKMVEIHGVRKRGWTALHHCGKSPSRDIE